MTAESAAATGRRAFVLRVAKNGNETTAIQNENEFLPEFAAEIL